MLIDKWDKKFCIPNKFLEVTKALIIATSSRKKIGITSFVYWLIA